MIWAVLGAKNEDKIYVNQDETLTDLQIFIKYSFLLNFSWISNELFKYRLLNPPRSITKGAAQAL